MQNDLSRLVSYGEAIREALHQTMNLNDKVIIVGEGVPDPKAIFGTTEGLLDRFGSSRVFDMPLAENGMTGICIGAALNGLRPVMVHQRIDFLMLAMDQIVNNAAKWFYTFNGQASVPLVIRCIVGRGWGQGPQHSQSLQSLFAHIPGLKVILPAMGYDAKGMINAAIADNNPVIIIEHRWLFNIQDNVPEHYYISSLEGARVIRQGNDITIAAFSYMVIEALKVAKVLANFGVSVEVLDMRVASPLDNTSVLKSIRKTGLLLAIDTGWLTAGLASEIIASAVENGFELLKKPPQRIGLPPHPCPTSPDLAKNYYPNSLTIMNRIFKMLDKDMESNLEEIKDLLAPTGAHDQPHINFQGPF